MSSIHNTINSQVQKATNQCLHNAAERLLPIQLYRDIRSDSRDARIYRFEKPVQYDDADSFLATFCVDREEMFVDSSDPPRGYCSHNPKAR